MAVRLYAFNAGYSTVSATYNHAGRLKAVANGYRRDLGLQRAYVIDDRLGFLDMFGPDLMPAQQSALRSAALDWVKVRAPHV